MIDATNAYMTGGVYREIVPGETIPAETGITDVAVSFTKGCYPGQELVERMWTGLGELPGVTRYGPPPGRPRTPTVSFTVAGRAITSATASAKSAGGCTVAV